MKIKENGETKRKKVKTSLVIQWLELCLPLQGVQVQSLVGEPRSHMPCRQKAKHKTSNIVTNSIKTLKQSSKNLKGKKRKNKKKKIEKGGKQQVLFQNIKWTTLRVSKEVGMSTLCYYS